MTYQPDNRCDCCGHESELYFNEATGLAFCEACDLTSEEHEYTREFVIARSAEQHLTLKVLAIACLWGLAFWLALIVGAWNVYHHLHLLP